MEKIEDQRRIARIRDLFLLVYLVSYLTRINYGAVITEMSDTTSMTRSALSLALTGSFITYGCGQFISGVAGDRFSPKKCVLFGLALSSAMNFLIPLCSGAAQMTLVWSVNGFAQAFIWPPMTKLLSGLLTQDSYKAVCSRVCWGASLGTILVYLIAPVLMKLLHWKAVFLFSGICGIAATILWSRKCPAYTHQNAGPVSAGREKTGSGRLISPLILALMAAILLQGMLRDGITTWMPAYVAEVYHLDNYLSVLINVILPVFGIVCLEVSTRLYRFHIKNPVTCAAFFFCLGAVASAALVFLPEQNAGVAVLCAAVLKGSMHGVNLMLVSMIPLYFQKMGKVSTMSGILNSCVYLGSALSSYGIAALADRFGWGINLVSWLVVSVLGSVLCLLSIRPWQKQYMDHQ